MTTQIQSNLAPHRQNGGDAAVVFLHGFGGNLLSTWANFPACLAADKRLDGWDIFSLGYSTSLSLEVSGIWTADPPLISVADLLRTHAGLTPLKNYSAIALVAHSMGGLVAQRALLHDHQFASRVSHLILFGTPSNGLAKAWWLRFWKRSIENMAEGSDFVTDLRRRWNVQYASGPSFRFLTIAGDQDEFVPRTSSIDPFPQEYRRVIVGDHLTIVKPASAQDPNVQLVLESLIGGAAFAGPMNSAAVAVESRQFQQAIERLWPNRAQLDRAATVQLALALDGVGRAPEAIEVLEQSRHRGNTDAMGVLAGRLKRRWITERVENDAQRARELYARAYELAAHEGDHAQAFYLGINVAFMDLVYGENPQQAAQMATEVLNHCTAAARDVWCLATEGEAYLHLGKIDDAVQRYSDAIARNPEPWQVRSIYKQAVIVARHCGDHALEARLETVLRGGEA